VKRSSPLRRLTPLGRATRLQVRPKRRDGAATDAAGVFKTAVCSEPCIGTRVDGHVCDGPLQAMHVVSKQTLRRRGLAHLVYDPVNGIAGCYLIHRRHDLCVEKIPRSLLPGRCVEWARAHGLLDDLLRHWPAESEVAA
jgi:hypothetical protein